MYCFQVETNESKRCSSDVDAGDGVVELVNNKPKMVITISSKVMCSNVLSSTTSVFIRLYY